jgi:phage gp16-like protein
MSTPRTPDQNRRAELAKIKIGQKALHLDDETYRDLLARLTGKRSASELDARGRHVVIDYMKGRGVIFTTKAEKKGPIRIDAERSGLLSVIGALLAEQKKPWQYAHQIAKNNFKTDRAEWLTAVQMRGLIAQLKKQNE